MAKVRKPKKRPAGVDDGKDKAAQLLGQRGGKARAQALSASKRKQIARAAAKARWGK
jgi:hypothetical protein